MYQLFIWYTVHLDLVHRNSVHRSAPVYQILTTVVHRMYHIIIPDEVPVLLRPKGESLERVVRARVSDLPVYSGLATPPRGKFRDPKIGVP